MQKRVAAIAGGFVVVALVLALVLSPRDDQAPPAPPPPSGPSMPVTDEPSLSRREVGLAWQEVDGVVRGLGREYGIRVGAIGQAAIVRRDTGEVVHQLPANTPERMSEAVLVLGDHAVVFDTRGAGPRLLRIHLPTGAITPVGDIGVRLYPMAGPVLSGRSSVIVGAAPDGRSCLVGIDVPALTHSVVHCADVGRQIQDLSGWPDGLSWRELKAEGLTTCWSGFWRNAAGQVTVAAPGRCTRQSTAELGQWTLRMEQLGEVEHNSFHTKASDGRDIVDLGRMVSDPFSCGGHVYWVHSDTGEWELRRWSPGRGFYEVVAKRTDGLGGTHCAQGVLSIRAGVRTRYLTNP